MGSVARLVIGKPEIADLLGVERKTPAQWDRRKILPSPDHPPVNGRDAWHRDTIVQWATRTGRLPGVES